MKKIFKVNPLTNKKDRPYQIDKKKVDVKYAYLEYEFPYKKYIISSKGEIFRKEGENSVIKVPIYQKKCGYYYIQIYKGNRSKKMFYVGRLVAKYFIKKTKKDVELERNIVHFIDWNREHVIPENLIWVNLDELNALISFKKAKNNKITIDDDLKYRYLNRFYKDKRYSNREIKRIFGIYAL